MKESVWKFGITFAIFTGDITEMGGQHRWDMSAWKGESLGAIKQGLGLTLWGEVGSVSMGNLCFLTGKEVVMGVQH